MSILTRLTKLKQEGKKGFALLIDPDKTSPSRCAELLRKVEIAQPEFIFVGGSLLMRDDLRVTIKTIRENSDVPVVLFPGNILQIEDTADGILFLSLISGRNPELLIGNHVVAAPLLKQSSLEVVPTGYMLIDSGRVTTAHYMSGTQGIPWDKPEIAACTAMAGEMLGLKSIYMDGGSGAAQSLSTKMVQQVAGSVEVPLIVGGGIRSVEEAARVFEAGADLIVIGTAFEQAENSNLASEMADLITQYSQNVSV